MTKREAQRNAVRFQKMPEISLVAIEERVHPTTPDPIPNSEVKLSIADDTA